MKKINIILFLVLIFSIILNIFLYCKLDKAYKKIDKYLNSSYTSVIYLLEDIESSLDDSMDFENFKDICDNTMAVDKNNTIYNYAMQTYAFKWLNSYYKQFSLDTFAMYISYIWETSPGEYEENYSSIKNMCKLWNELELKDTFDKDEGQYSFYKDEQDIKSKINKINRFCDNYMDKKEKEL